MIFSSLKVLLVLSLLITASHGQWGSEEDTFDPRNERDNRRHSSSYLEWYRNDYYGALGITKTATTAEVKRAYRDLALRVHPDKNPGNSTAASMFRVIADAYEVLKDADTRGQYDEFIAALPARWRPRYGGTDDGIRVWMVAMAVLGTISVFQYISSANHAVEMRRLARQQPKYIQACKIARANGEPDPDVIVHNAEPPTIEGLLFFQFPLIPLFVAAKIWAAIKWWYRYSWRLESLTEEDLEILAKGSLSDEAWSHICETQFERVAAVKSYLRRVHEAKRRVKLGLPPLVAGEGEDDDDEEEEGEEKEQEVPKNKRRR